MKKWILTETEFKANTALAYEGLFTLGSGYLHTRGSLEENAGNDPQNITAPKQPVANASNFDHSAQVAVSKWGTYVPGVFAQHPYMNEEIVNLPYFLGIEPTVAGEKLDVQTSKTSNYRRELNMKTASIERNLIWTTAEGNLQVKFERFISGKRTHLSVQKAEFKNISDKPIKISIKSGIDADVRTNGEDHFMEKGKLQSEIAKISENAVKSVVKTNFNPENNTGGDTIFTVAQVSANFTHLGELKGRWNYFPETRRGFFVAEFEIPAAESLIIEKRTAVATSRDLTPQTTPEQILAEAQSFSFEQLFDEHKAYWVERWSKSDIEIEGDDNSLQAIRTSIFHLLRCHVTGDSRVAIDAKGTAGDIYYGRFFWDTEIYLVPFFLYTDAERAKTLVDFRVQTLDGAKRNAEKLGYRGARFPWESDHKGNDCCPAMNWQYRDHEVHITADVVYAFAHFAANTSDEYLKNSQTAEVIVETARYWLDRVDWRKGDNYPSLLGVMGPDEYTALTSNNAYTNYMVKFALNLAAKYGKFGGAADKEIAEFKEVAEKLPIVRSKNNPNLIMQCEEFDSFAEPDFDKWWKVRTKHFAIFAPQERLYRTKCLKQADVLMLMYLFLNKFTDVEIRTAWDYYLQYTTHDSSLSRGAHAVLANKIGLEDEAFAMFNACKGQDLNVENGGAAEGIHIAGCGMNWQMVVFGAAGILNALQSDIFTMQPRLPRQWTKVSFPFVWKGQSLYISLTKDSASIENRSEKAIEVVVSGKKGTVEKGKIMNF
jgi:kojibiose phosphorylase